MTLPECRATVSCLLFVALWGPFHSARGADRVDSSFIEPPNWVEPNTEQEAIAATRAPPEATIRILNGLRFLSKLSTRSEITTVDTLAPLWDHPDQRIRQLATELSVRVIGSEENLRLHLMEFARGASIIDARRLVERLPRPLSDRAIDWISRLAERPSPAFGWIAADAISRLPSRMSESELTEPQIAEGAPFPIPLRHRIAGLRIVGGPRAGESLAIALANPATSGAALDAIDAISRRLLGASRVDSSVEFLDAISRRQPDHHEVFLQLARAVGIYQRNPEAPLREIERRLDRLPVGFLPASYLKEAELLVAKGELLRFSDALDDGEAALLQAYELLGTPPSNARSAAILAARVRLLLGLTALQRNELSKAREWLRDAVAIAPYDPYYGCLFDQALLGTIGPVISLDSLRRRDGPEIPEAFHRELQIALVESNDMLAILDVPSGGEADPDIVALDNERIKSWSPWYRIEVLLESGHAVDAVAIATDACRGLEQTNLFENQNLAARIRLQLAIGWMRLGSLEAARDEIRRAMAEATELNYSWRRSDMLATRGRFLPGSPPFPPPLASLVAAVEVVRSELLAHFGDLETAHDAAYRATLADPWGNLALVNLGPYLISAGNRDRAERIFESSPRTADLLYPLARLANCLGQTDEAERLFQLHLEWNALTDDRREQELSRRDSDPHF